MSTIEPTRPKSGGITTVDRVEKGNETIRFIKCLGEENLGKAISDCRDDGFVDRHVVFMGIKPVRRSGLALSQDEAIVPVPQYLLIAEKMYLPGVTPEETN
jgi:hypothetical protein